MVAVWLSNVTQRIIFPPTRVAAVNLSNGAKSFVLALYWQGVWPSWCTIIAFNNNLTQENKVRTKEQDFVKNNCWIFPFYHIIRTYCEIFHSTFPWWYLRFLTETLGFSDILKIFSGIFIHAVNVLTVCMRSDLTKVQSPDSAISYFSPKFFLPF